MKRLHHYSIAAAAILAIAGCASNPKEIQSIADARATIEQVERSPLAGEAAAQEIAAAHASLVEAQELARKHKSEREINNAAYAAKKHAQIAQEQITALAAKKQTEKANEQRQAILLESTEREAAIKAEEAERAKREAELQRERVAQLEKELNDMNAKKTERGYVLTLGDVLFDTGKATLKPGAQTTLDRLATFLKDAPDRQVTIEGHTDNVGSDEFNQQLSEQRASAVQQALQSRGVAADRVKAIGKGEGFPVASNDSPGGRQQNRRVEIIIEEPVQASASARD